MLLDPNRQLRKEHTLNPFSGYVLLTGATGFLGQYLLHDLMNLGVKVAVVVRPSKKLSAFERIENIMQRWEQLTGSPLPRPVLLEGDIKADKILSDEDQAWAKNNVDAIIHNAAILKFDGDETTEPWTTNVGGTQNVVQLAQDIAVDNLQYVSTAYVCGIQNGRALETSLDNSQQFRNIYERSKFVAEKVIRESGIPNITVFRPAVIVGDSENGFTCSYHGLYVYLRLMAMLIPQQARDENGVAITPIKLPIRGDEKRNLVPVNWVSEIITSLSVNPDAWGNTFHLAPRTAMTPKALIDYCYDYFNSAGVEYCGPGIGNAQPSEFGANYMENTDVYQAYDTSDPEFDTTNLMRFVPDNPCPEIDRETIHKFFDFCEADSWGKKKIVAPQCDFWLHENLKDVANAIDGEFSRNGHANTKTCLSLRVIGPGGGDWIFERSPTGTQVRKGMSESASYHIELDSSQLQQQNGEQFTWASLVKSWVQK